MARDPSASFAQSLPQVCARSNMRTSLVGKTTDCAVTMNNGIISYCQTHDDIPELVPASAEDTFLLRFRYASLTGNACVVALL
jgi:hypothetical protein